MTTMTDHQIEQTVIQVLGRIAPEADLAAIAPNVSFRDQLDIDSFDFLTFVIGIDEALGVDIPEADYDKLSTLDGAVAYLKAAGVGASAGATSG